MTANAGGGAVRYLGCCRWCNGDNVWDLVRLGAIFEQRVNSLNDATKFLVH